MNSLDEVLKEVRTAAVSGHVRPDGDCAGSCLAVYNYIREVYPGVDVHLFLEPIPEKFRFLKNADRIEDAASAGASGRYDLFIALDCSDEERLGAAADLFRKAERTVCIDHHLTNESFADENYIDPQASSASELVYDLLDKAHLTKEIAECLYLGIVHDTGVFQYSCTSRKTMCIAGELMETGIDYPRIVDETFFIKTYPQLRIWGRAMQESTLYLDGKCIGSVITAEDVREFGASYDDLDGIVSQLRSTAGVEAAVFLYEINGAYKVSLRSASYVDVAKIASSFGGGGHARAAGFSAQGAPRQIMEKVLAEIRTQLR